MTSKSTKRALITSVLSILMCVAMLIGTTFAWFTDTASTGVNKIQAGNLDVQLLDATTGDSIEGETLQFKKAAGATQGEQVLWEPGCTYELPAFKVKNNGNLALKYKIVISGIKGSAKLNEAIEWTMTNGGTPVNINDGTEVSLAPNATSGNIIIKGQMKKNAGNEYQGLSIDGIAITVYATQKDTEFDSFNNSYDAGATYPVEIIPAVNATMAAAAPNEDGKIESYSFANSDNTLTAIYKPNTAAASSAAAPKIVVKPTSKDAGHVTIDTATQEAIAYDISLQDAEGTALSNSGLTTLTIKVGTGLTGVVLYHNNIPMTKVDSKAAVDADGEFYYDGTTGTVTFATSSFSPFTIVFDSPVAVAGGVSYYDLQSALNAGGDVILLKDIETPTVTYTVTKDVTLDLNGKTLSGSGYDGTLCVTSGKLTINGDGKVIGNDDRNYGMAVWACGENSELVINGGEYSNTLDHEDNQMDMIYVSDGADAVIKGGTFKCATPKWTLNIKDANHANGSSTFTVTGGKFYQYDPANSATESPVANFCGAGYGAIKNGDWYEVISGKFVSTEAELKDALAGTDSTIYLAKDIALTEAITINRNCTLIGNGNATISAQSVYVASTANVTFKNVNFATPDNKDDNASSVYASGLKGKVEFDGCTFTNPQWECIQITPMDGAEVVVTNCTFVVDGTGTYAHGDKVERMLHIQNTAASGKYTAVITDNTFIGVDLCRNSVIDVDDISAFANVTCGGNTFFNHDNTTVSTLADGMIYVNINRRFTAAYVATDTYAQFTQTPAAALHH